MTGMHPARSILMLGLCLAILGPVWPKALVKAMFHPTEGVMAQDDVSDADDSLPGILTVTMHPGVEPVRCTIVPMEPSPLVPESRQTTSGPRAPPSRRFA